MYQAIIYYLMLGGQRYDDSLYIMSQMWKGIFEI